MAQTAENRTIGNASTESRLDVDVSDIIFHTGEPSDTPLIALTGGKLYTEGKSEPKEVPAKIKREVATEISFKVIEKDPLARTITVNGAVADTTTTSITVDSQTSAYAGDLLINNRTGEKMYLYTRTSATAIIVRRNLGSTAFQIADDDVLSIYSYGAKQGSAKRGMRSQLAAARERYVQIFKRSFGVTDTLMNVLLVTALNDWDEEMNQALVNHKLDIEGAAWYGPAVDSTTDADGNTVYLSRGIIAELGSSREIDCDGALDEDMFFGSVAESMFKYGPSRKKLFCDSKLLTKINGFSRVKQQTSPKMTDYGVNVTEIETGHGIIDVMRCGIFGKYNSTEGFGVCLDVDSVIYKHIKNRDSKYQVDIQTPGDDVKEAQFITEAGFSIRNLDFHRTIANIG